MTKALLGLRLKHERHMCYRLDGWAVMLRVFFLHHQDVRKTLASHIQEKLMGEHACRFPHPGWRI